MLFHLVHRREGPLHPPNDAVLQALLDDRADQLPLSSTAKRRILEEAAELSPKRDRKSTRLNSSH
jgi:hypothetical protein